MIWFAQSDSRAWHTSRPLVPPWMGGTSLTLSHQALHSLLVLLREFPVIGFCCTIGPNFTDCSICPRACVPVDEADVFCCCPYSQYEEHAALTLLTCHTYFPGLVGSKKTSCCTCSCAGYSCKATRASALHKPTASYIPHFSLMLPPGLASLHASFTMAAAGLCTRLFATSTCL